MTMRVWTVLCVAVLACGCGRKEAPPTTRTESDASSGIDLRNELFAEVQQVRDAATAASLSGDFEEARRILTEAIADPRYAEFRNNLLNSHLQTSLDSGDLAGAMAIFEKYAVDNPGFAMQGLGAIDGFGSQDESVDTLVEWYKSLIGSGLDDSAEAALMRRLLQLGQKEVNPEELASLFGLAVEHMSEDEAAGYAARIMNVAKARAADGLALPVIERMEQDFGDHPAMKVQTYLARINLQVTDGEFESALDALTDESIEIDINDAVPVAVSIIDAATEKGDFETAQKVVSGFPDLAPRADSQKLGYRIREGELAEAEELLLSKLDTFDEPVTDGHAIALLDAHMTGNRHVEADRIAENLIKRLSSGHQAQYSVGRIWIESALAQEEYSATLDRMEDLANRGGGSLRAVGEGFRSDFYRIAVREKKDELDRLAALARLIITGADELRLRQGYVNLALDAAFMARDYDTCLEILAQGVPGYDEDWTAAMAVKIGAHKSISEGDLKAAAKGFRAFMEYLAAEGNDVNDPISGGSRPHEEILGFNADRIGDLLTEAGDSAGAAAAYAEAREFYETAITKVEADSADAERIRKALEEVAAAPAMP